MLHDAGKLLAKPPLLDDAPILFYTDIRRTFRTTLIGYLYQLCRVRHVVLLTEELDPEVDRLLADKAMFPGLCERIFVGQYARMDETMLARHRRMSRLAKEVIRQWRPSVVFAAGINIFECYMRREARKVGPALLVGCIGLLLVRHPGEVADLLDRHTAEIRFPSWLPRRLRYGLAKIRRQLAQMAYYAAAPVATGNLPFLGINGVYRLDYTRLHDVDLTFVFSQANREMLLAAGVPAEKLRVIPHPMKPGAADPVWQALGLYVGPYRHGECGQVATCFLDIETCWGFRRADGALIPDDTLYASRLEVVKAISEALPGWEIRIKPHPMSVASPIYERVRNKALQACAGRIVWLSPSDPAEKHIAESSMVAGFPPASTTLYSAALMRPGLPVIMVDINWELRGNAYEGFKGIETINTIESLAFFLEMIRCGVWQSSSFDYGDSDYEKLPDALIRANSDF